MVKIKTLHILRSLWQKKTLVRSLMNYEFSLMTLSGRVLDIGGGKAPSYLRFFQIAEGTDILAVDFEKGKRSGHALDLEKDALPYGNDTFDTVLVINLLEHIYHYNFVVQELTRVLKTGGRVIGFVPFLVNVHPDPHDYFRYTKETLEKIFTEHAFSEITVTSIGYGPFAISYNTLAPILPRIFSLLAPPFYFALDNIILFFRPTWKERFPLGYIFTMKK